MSPGFRIVTAPRAPIILVLLLLALLLLPPQMADMLQAVGDRSSQVIAFQICLAHFALSAWFWARGALNFAIGRVDGDSAAARQAMPFWLLTYFKWVPRVLFLLVAAAGLVVCLRSAAFLQAAAIAVWTLAGSVCLIFRKRLFPGTPGIQPRLSPNSIADIDRAAPFGARWLASAIVLVAALAFIASVVETSTGWEALRYDELLSFYCPGPTAALIGLAFILGPLTWLTMLGDGPLSNRLCRGRCGLPVIAIMAVLIVASFGVTTHPVRVAAGSDSHARGGLAVSPAADPANAPGPQLYLQGRQNLSAVFDAWLAECGGASDTVHPIVVALSGGASRAGLWATRVLRAVDAVAPEKASGIFAISSVSGGSLGAADYLIARAGGYSANPCHLRDSQSVGQTPNTSYTLADDKTVHRFRSDILGPLLSSAILMDSVRALIAWPLHLIWPSWPPRDADRAASLERAIERAWTGEPLTPSDAFLSLFYDQPGHWRPGMPLWLSNGTDVEGGERLITMATASDNSALAETWPFEGAKDVLRLLESDVPISTAVHNSARFPILSPTGTLVPITDVADGGESGKRADIADGGYFENSGVTTAFELIQWMVRNHRHQERKVEPILVVVDSDAEATVQPAQVPRCGSGPSRDPASLNQNKPAAQIIAPLIALYSVRSGHAEYAIEKAIEALCNGQLSNQVAAGATSASHEVCPDPPPPSMFNFYLHASETKPIPLNWVLSKEVVHEIWCGLRADNAVELTRLQQRIFPDADVKADPLKLPGPCRAD